MAFRSNCVFDHKKYGWSVDGIINLGLNLINTSASLISICEEPFTLENWGKTRQFSVKIVNEFYNGLLVTSWIVISYWVDNDRKLHKEILEKHNANEENIFNWLWEKRDYLLVDEKSVGWDYDEKRFILSNDNKMEMEVKLDEELYIRQR